VKSFRTLKKDFIENRWRIGAGLFALFIVDVLQLFIPRVVKYAIDDLTAGTVSSMGLLVYAGEVLALAAAIGGLRYVWRYLLMGAARRIERSLRDRLFSHLQNLSPSYFSRSKIGDLMAHATNDIEAVRMSLAMGFMFLVDTVILGVLTLSFMVYIDPKLTLYAILPMPLITIITLFFSRFIHERFEALQQTFSSLTERVRESIAGIRVVKAYVQEEVEREKLSSISRDYIQKNIEVTKVWGMFFPLILLLSNFSLAIVLYAGGRLTILQAISTGDFVAFMSYLGILAWPMMALGWAINVTQRGGASLDRLNRIFAEVPEVSDDADTVSYGSLKGKIEIKGLNYPWRNGAGPIIREIDLTIRQGENVVIVGRTGSGKTVLCNLLVRILEPAPGAIYFDSVEVHRIPLSDLRGSIAYVPQDTFLFSDTIRENIAFGRPGASLEEVEEAARMAQVYDEIMAFPEGMKTVIGEKGVTLSGGQRQRVSIARALLMDCPIFVLDDALSSVDIQTEERILGRLEKFFRNKTTILITHRVAPLRRAGRIVVLDQGRIVEEGNHETLLARGGVYAELYRQRQLEEEVEKVT
jgi:ATP-binding cassette, subfamily B, multidrug efflux pump